MLLNRVKLDEASSIFEKIRFLVESHEFLFEGKPINITISIGVYHSSQLEVQELKTLS
ncbi:hypothetical protein [Neptuniibacter sp. UBA6509]|uniref:hypothetical protein n=1 Tax=Neptuniibacter sp. UBA6509 TaxID=1946976 RepID=UPI0025DC37EB|nr:hypothetical protein [Neptuniibacter sp. UBA6509]